MEFEVGSKAICTEPNWFNAFGEHSEMPVGARLTVIETIRVAGTQFLKFAEYPESSFMSHGFKNLRQYN